MEYIISEDELINYTSKVREDNSESLIGTLYKDFLKSKQPVELLEKARMTVDENNKPKLYTVHPNDHWKTKGEQFGSLYKIYIEKVKE